MTTESTTTSPAEVARFFRRYGWTFDQIDDDTFRTSFRGKNAAFVALVRVTEHWVVFTINPFVKVPDDGFGPVALKLLARKKRQKNTLVERKNVRRTLLHAISPRPAALKT